jgi:hypothetical protein
MMKMIPLFAFVAVLFATECYGQNEFEVYKRIYRTADSLKAIGRIRSIDTTSVLARVRVLDRKHPADFFMTSGQLFRDAKMNEAALVYLVGQMRYRYYNSANPNFKQGEDGALLGSFNALFNELMNMYLRTDVDNYLAIVKLTVSYCKKHDYKFFSRSKNIVKYDAQIRSINEMIHELETNKEKYQLTWMAERKALESKIDSLTGKRRK